MPGPLCRGYTQQLIVLTELIKSEPPIDLPPLSFLGLLLLLLLQWRNEELVPVREILRNFTRKGDERKGEYIYNVLEDDYARRGPRGIVLALGGRCSRNSKTCRAISLQACRRDGE